MAKITLVGTSRGEPYIKKVFRWSCKVYPMNLEWWGEVLDKVLTVGQDTTTPDLKSHGYYIPIPHIHHFINHE
jgi:hypothetical protein